MHLEIEGLRTIALVTETMNSSISGLEYPRNPQRPYANHLTSPIVAR